MTALTVQKKRNDLSAQEKRELYFAKGLLREIKKSWGNNDICKDFMPSCPACAHGVFIGGLKEHIDLLEF